MKTISYFSTSSPSSSSSSTSSQQQVRNSINDSIITEYPLHKLYPTISRGTKPIIVNSSSFPCPHLSTADNIPSTPTICPVHSPINNIEYFATSSSSLVLSSSSAQPVSSSTLYQSTRSNKPVIKSTVIEAASTFFALDISGQDYGHNYNVFQTILLSELKLTNKSILQLSEDCQYTHIFCIIGEGCMNDVEFDIVSLLLTQCHSFERLRTYTILETSSKSTSEMLKILQGMTNGQQWSKTEFIVSYGSDDERKV